MCIRDSNKIDTVFNVGDTVFIDNGNKLNREKLDEVRIGPFVFSQKLSDHVFEIDLGTRGNFAKRLYHTSKLLHSPV